MKPRATRGELVCHVLLVESGDGLVLVDSGFGLRDVADTSKRLGPSRLLIRPVLDPDETAIAQVRALGFDPAEVRDIVLTHFDADHVGGLADFPAARVHLTTDEAEAALHPRTRIEKSRYLPACRDHDPVLVRHDASDTESWRGFPGAVEIVDGVVLVPLPGHTRGHAAVAVEAGNRWILHAGDAFYLRRQLDHRGRVPRGIGTMERTVAHDWSKVRANHRRLAEVLAADDPTLLLVNAHDPELLERARATA